MDLKVFWTDSAKNQLEDIFDYYKEKASLKIARKIVGRIVDQTLTLEKHPNAGPKENLLSERNNEYRYLVIDNYKVIYWVEGGFAKIATVFDCRQNPSKLEEI